MPFCHVPHHLGRLCMKDVTNRTSLKGNKDKEKEKN